MFLYWIDKQRLGGASQPFLQDLPFLKNIELGGIVCLQEGSTSEELATLLDVNYLHIPLSDFSIPSEGDIETAVDFYVENQEKNPNLPILVHCTAGHGRTGTILAALLVLVDHFAPREAITCIRAVNPFAIETKEQEQFILSL
ncbi:MAG: dual specificity protein phosphatase family protein [Candidatus Hodarchaeota archaeon]